MYKGKQATTNIYCWGELDTCLQCPGEKIKMSPGDSVSLCDGDCGGYSKVANTEHKACGKLNFTTSALIGMRSIYTG